ncbi:hypothetical protein C8J57DRAFT_1220931 [Mycena rebaudengoi]|nr:hypothetical protein C8J57DRAFT_1220931 [Mycena rebaudengoi]
MYGTCERPAQPTKSNQAFYMHPEHAQFIDSYSEEEWLIEDMDSGYHTEYVKGYITSDEESETKHREEVRQQPNKQIGIEKDVPAMTRLPPSSNQKEKVVEPLPDIRPVDADARHVCFDVPHVDIDMPPVNLSKPDKPVKEIQEPQEDNRSYSPPLM